MRRTWLHVLGALCAGTLLACGARKDALPGEPAPSARNLVLVTVDTLRADAVGAYGGEDYTPHMDRLAERGVLFEQAYSTAPFTGPSHASILTSRHPSKHGVLFNGNRVQGQVTEDSTFLSEHLLHHGFRTGAVVSPSPTSSRYGFARGFEVFEERCEATGGDAGGDGPCILSHVRRFLREHADERFFLWVHLFDPHLPYVGPQHFYEELGLEREDYIVRRTQQAAALPPERLRTAYLADVYQGDHYVGQVLHALADLDLLDTTVLAVTSDHGEYLGEHGLFDHSKLYDEVLHVPLIISAPGLEPGRRPEQVSSIDLAPTLLELLEVAPLPSPQGHSVLARGAHSDEVFAEWRHFRIFAGSQEPRPGDYQLGMRTPAYKLIEDELFPGPGNQLYDLTEDPAESDNLMGMGRPVEVSLVERLGAHKRDDLEIDHLTQIKVQFDEEDLEMLEALGYSE